MQYQGNDQLAGAVLSILGKRHHCLLQGHISPLAHV